MTTQIISAAALMLLSRATWPAQTPETAPRFEFADVHPAPKPSVGRNEFMRTGPVRNGRYQVHTASLLDLIRYAWGYDPDNVVGGPPWIDIRHFEIGAKVANDTPPGTLKLMLQTLLEDRFALKVHKDARPLPGFVLTAGKKPKLKEADGSGDTGCRLIRPPAQSTGMIALNGMAVAAGPAMLVHYSYANVTMDAFATALHTMVGSGVGTSLVRDETALKGRWTFDVRWSLQVLGGAGEAERISAADAIEKQLGLKLEQRSLPTPVLVVDSVKENPAPNPSGTAEALPPIPAPTAFEVADIRPTDPDFRGGRFQTQNGRFLTEGMPMMFLLNRAFDIYTNDQIVGLPPGFNALRFNVTAKLPADADPDLDMASLGPLLRNLLIERFGLKYHTENRPQTVYRLLAVKPKMKKADPASRMGCRNERPPAGSPPGTAVLVCQNTTMEQFAGRLRGASPQLALPIEEETRLEGGWDFTLSFDQRAGTNVGDGGRGGPAGVNGVQAGQAPDPGDGVTIFEAVEKQLGLKLEAGKRPMPVYVIDHIESRPTVN